MLSQLQRALKLPTTATAPFCPSEIKGSVIIRPDEPFWKKLLRFIGPGLLVSVGYMDPGNWATDIEAGTHYGYELLWVVVLSSLAAIILQCLSMRLGIVTGKDLAQLSRDHYTPGILRIQWIMAELSIIACNLAEVLGSSLAFHLLLGCPLSIGVLLTILDTFIVLGLKGKNVRHVEAIILGLISTIGICYGIELFLATPNWPDITQGLWPSGSILTNHNALYVAIGILGATVMPHNLYLHSSLVQTRWTNATDDRGKQEVIYFSRLDTIVSLSLALVVNAAILILAATAFHTKGISQATDIESAYHLLDPVVGTTLASILFGIALLAAGQSSTFTGTIAGQILLEGFLNLKIPCWQRRLITRGLALIPAFLGVVLLGDSAVGKLLIISQVVLSLQLPFAIYPLIRFTSSDQLMGVFKNSILTRFIAWFLFALISTANGWLVFQTVTGS